MPMQVVRHLWVVVLAGGDGTRVAGLTRDESGASVPKQYSRAFGEITLLERALARARRLVPPARVAVVVAERHRRWWQPLLRKLPVENVLAQPENRGTAAGVLFATRSLIGRDRAARLLVLPSDHHVRDEDGLAESLVEAVDALHRDDTRLVLVGMPSDAPDPEYGWIVPASSEGALTEVTAFCEKPTPAGAAALRRRGALINTLMFSATGTTLLELFARYAPELVRAFADREARSTAAVPAAALRGLYAGLPTLDFSRLVLERATESLSVLRGRECGWTDLGTPGRVRPHRVRGVASRSGAAPWPDGVGLH